MTLTTFFLDLLLFIVAFGHVLWAPYTKVEESFNLHAVHDTLAYGVRPEVIGKWDHVIFPGAVPRTFIGSVTLAWLAEPTLRLGSALGIIESKFHAQIAVRLCLAALNTAGIVSLRRSVRHRFGLTTSHLFALISMTQFHLPFWIGRTLPNMFALLPVNIAHALILDQAPHATKPTFANVQTAISLLTFATVVFRSELIALLGASVVQALVFRHTSFWSVVKTGLVSGILSVGLTVLVDSYFWDQFPLWPEFSGLYFNVFQGKSSEWGTSAVHAYFKEHLPKLLLTSNLLGIWGFVVDKRIRSFVLPSLVFVSGLSLLPHKEWRFVVYTVPVFNVAAARGARSMLGTRRTLLMGKDMLLIVTGLLFMNVAVSGAFLRSSMANYPGGEAMYVANTQLGDLTAPHIHISNLAAQTGASLFTQEYAPPYLPFQRNIATKPWVYNKTEALTPRDLSRGSFTHIIAEAPLDVALKGVWKGIGKVDGFAGWSLDGKWKRALRRGDVSVALECLKEGGPLQMRMEEKLVLLERA